MAVASTSFRLAHMSDVHVFTAAALWTPTLLEPKRLLGALNVAFRRGPRAYDRNVLQAALRDAVAQGRTDHLAISGDITNLATAAEFALAARIVREGYGDAVSTVPGNHDIYTPSSDRHRYYARTATTGPPQYFGATAAGTDAVEGAVDGFPYLQRLWGGRVALIGLNSAVWRPPFVASGRLGAAQLASLARLLQSEPARSAPFKIVMLHHPPLERYRPRDSPRYSLDDQYGSRPMGRTELQAILEAHPVDLVLHGHTHRPYSGPLLPSEDQRRPWVYEAGSGTFVPSARRPHGHVARYNVYELCERSQGARVVLHQAFARVYDPTTGLFETKQLPLPAP